MRPTRGNLDAFGEGDSAALRPGVYLVEEKEWDFTSRQFISLTAAGRPGLVITRRYPNRVRRERGFAGSRIVWLSRAPGQDHHDPTELEPLAKLISEFIDEYRRAVVILDGLDYLFVNNGYHQTLMFVERVKEFVTQLKAIMLIPVSPDTLEDRELAELMGRSPTPFSSVILPPHGKGRGEFVKRTAPGVLLIPMESGLVGECERLREVMPMPVDIDNTDRPVDERIREARRSHAPFIVLVTGGELRSRIVHALLWTGKETWMSLDALTRAFNEWRIHG